MKNTENLIGKKVYGFKHESEKVIYNAESMDSYIGKIGKLTQTYLDGTCKIVFEDDYFFYPTDQIEAHLVEEESVKEEIPTLNDGVLMLVSDDGENWQSDYVFAKRNDSFLVWNNLGVNYWNYCKPLPTKEEQLTEILGSSEKVAEIMELFKNE